MNPTRKFTRKSQKPVHRQQN